MSEEEDEGNNESTYNSNKEQCKINLRIQPIEMCTLASNMEGFEGIDRMQQVARLLHDYAIENGVGPECLQFSTEMGNISVMGG